MEILNYVPDFTSPIPVQSNCFERRKQYISTGLTFRLTKTCDSAGFVFRGEARQVLDNNSCKCKLNLTKRKSRP